MMYQAFSTLKVKMEVKPVVDSLIFRLHYKYTYAIFMASVILTTLYDAIGNQIDCLTTIDDDSFKDVVDSYCFIMGTFTVNRHHIGIVGEDIPHPGVGPLKKDEPVTYHTYYQWVPFVLFVQAVTFYLPHWLWKGLEGGTFRNIIQKLSIRDYLGGGKGIDTYFTRDSQFAALSKYIQYQMANQRSWALKFFFCEALNLGVTIGMIFFTDWFLGGEFLKYGVDIMEILTQEPENRTDPMSFVFPKMAKCTFKSFGASGTIQIRDVMCLIATNIINEKIYIFLWVWLILLSAVTSLWLLARLLVIVIPSFRQFILKMYVTEDTRKDLATVMKRHSSLSEWLLLHNLGRNMDQGIFSEFISHFAGELVHSADTLRVSDSKRRFPSPDEGAFTKFDSPDEKQFCLDVK